MTNSDQSKSETEEYKLEAVTPEKWNEIKSDVMEIEVIDFSASELDEDEEEMSETFLNPISMCFVIKNSRNKIVAYLTAGPLELFDYLDFIKDDPHFGQSNTMYLSSIAVHPSHQGKGLGKKLIATLAAESKIRGYTRLTGHFLDLSELIFQKMGGKIVKEYENWYDQGKHATYMVIDLPESPY
jgi:GNAT superfamily N-acetyltransferase